MIGRRMRRRGTMFAAVAVALLMALTAGCSGGGSGKKTPDAGAATTTASSSAVSAQASELAGLSEKFASSPFEGHYSINSSGEQPLNGYVTIYQDGTGRSRFDITSNENDQVLSLILIEAPESSTFCLPDAGDLAPLLGIEPGKGVCLNNDPSNGADDLGSITASFSDLKADELNVTNTSTRTIAGQTANCYDYTVRGADGQNQTCFSPDGLALFDKSVTSSDTTVLDAQQVKPSADASLFNPPYEVKDLPS